MPVRLNRYLASTGVGSRRAADEVIRAGRVTVNGAAAELGTLVSDGDDVRVDGRTIRAKTKQGRKVKVYIALNKPVGVTCTTERHVKGNIVDFVGHEKRIFPIGRLDKDSEGLILLTSNGDIVNEILRADERGLAVDGDAALDDQAIGLAARAQSRVGDVLVEPHPLRSSERGTCGP